MNLIDVQKLKGENYLLLYPVTKLKGGALFNVKYGGRSDVLIETLSDAMLDHEGLALVVTYAADQFKKKKHERELNKKTAAQKKAADQLELF